MCNDLVSPSGLCPILVSVRDTVTGSPHVIPSLTDSVHSGACGAPNFPGPREKSPRRTAPWDGAGHKIDRVGCGGVSFWAPRSHPRSGAAPGAPRFFNNVDGAFYACDRIFYGRDGVFRTICGLSAYFKLLSYAGAA